MKLSEENHIFMLQSPSPKYVRESDKYVSGDAAAAGEYGHCQLTAKRLVVPWAEEQQVFFERLG